MSKNITQKIIERHLVSGRMIPGEEISIRIDQTLTQDSTGTMAYLQLEAMNIDRVKTKLSVAYIDHNTLQQGFENADDHKYIQTVASRYGSTSPDRVTAFVIRFIWSDLPRAGPCLAQTAIHQPQGHRHAGNRSRRPGCGSCHGGGPYYLTMPKVCRIWLEGKLQPWVSAKDVILKILSILSVKGGVGKVIEYAGPGVASLTVPERATITNMGAELGATTSIFPSDENTRAFLRAQGREDMWIPLEADPDASYEEELLLDLSEIEPMVAKPHSPDNVESVRETKNVRVDQVAIGSCTNSSYLDLIKAARILKGKTVHPDVSLVIAPGSKQVYTMLSRNGAMADLIDAGARILESACGPCIGMGQAPASDAVSLRTFNRNFYGRSGTVSAQVYLVSPEIAAVSALTGRLTDPREYGEPPRVEMPEFFTVNDNGIIPPANNPESVEVVRGQT